MPASPGLPGQPRPGRRLARSPALTAQLAARLTARDRWLLRMICEHRVLTTTHITQLAFGTTRAATARMLTLYQHRAVDRFRPLVPAGSAPLHFILDETGAAVIAAEDGTTPAALGYRRDRAQAIALSPRLAHTTGTSTFFTTLAAAARTAPGHAALETWWPERRCAALWGDHARPDGYGRWHEHLPASTPRTTDFFLEYDTGTENLGRLIAKLAGYRDLAQRTGIPTPVLFWLPTPKREAALRARLNGPPPPGTPAAATAATIPGVPVATGVHGTSPAGPAWLPAGTTGPRIRLARLSPPGTLTPAPDHGSQHSALPWHAPSPAPPAWLDLPRTPTAS